jgi:hypothetical protein
LILSLAIVILATNHWTNLTGFPEYLSVAATITSLVLGILAIIYSFVSSGAMNQFLGSIQSSTSTMSDVAVELRDVLNKGQDIQSRAESRTEELHDLAQSLTQSLSSLEESTKNIAGKVESIPTQLSSLQESIAAQATLSAVPSSTSDAEKSIWTKSEIEAVLKAASPYGMLVLKGVSVAKDEHRFLDVAKVDSPDLYYYGYGFLMAIQATGLITLEFAEKKNGVHAVRLLNGADEIQALINAEWESRKKDKKRSKFVLSKEPNIASALHDGSIEESDTPE